MANMFVINMPYYFMDTGVLLATDLVLGVVLRINPFTSHDFVRWLAHVLSEVNLSIIERAVMVVTVR